MPLVIVAVAVVLLILLMTRFKLNGFISLLVVSVLVGVFAVATGTLTYDDDPAGLVAIADLIEDGIGSQMSSTLVVIGVGAMIGRVIGDAGAAQRIALKIVDVFGERGVQWAMVVTSVVIGITMFYEVAFVIIVPVAVTLVRATRQSLLWIGLPMSITLSTMHSFLPPHPGPTAVAGMYDASVGHTLAIGLLIALPIGIVVAIVRPRLPFVRTVTPEIPQGLISDKEFSDDELPPMARSLMVALLPVILIAGAALYDMAQPADNLLTDIIGFVGSPAIALLIALLTSIVVFSPAGGRSMSEVAASMADGAKSMAMILMVIAGGGAFKQVLTGAGVADYIAELTGGWSISPIILAWIIAVILRIALGSASVAVATAAGIAAPLVAVFIH
ncbi:gluconate:H+ symporter [Actinomyces procaprae]|uniref:GntT/GntP/DsdX family permease n=1 Tax=Actinomyces procaprae TaxID=2560010 RepID=UPI0010A28EDB|nr:gluconate:H+ symporter [Actinomyces procaprae]